MLTREQIEEIETERREKGNPTKRTLRRQNFYFFAIHLTWQSLFLGPAGHIDPRDGTDLCPSSEANPSRHRSNAHRTARCLQEARRTYNDLPLAAKHYTDLPHTLQWNMVISVGLFVYIANG